MTAYDVTTYDAFTARRITGVPGVAVRLGRALEKWGRDAAEPRDPMAVRREIARQEQVKVRMLTTQGLGYRHW